MLAGTSQGFCDGLEIDFSIESDASEQEIATLIRLSHQMCFTEDALAGQVKITKRHQLNGLPFDAG